MAQMTLTRNSARAKARPICAVPALIKVAPPLLELHLHLLNGTTRTFVQNDPDLARQLLRQMGPRVFAQPALILHGPDQVTAFPGSALAGLSILMDPLPEELLRLDPFPCVEVTQEEYQAERYTQAGIIEGRPFLMLSEVEMSSGRRLWFAIQVSEAMGGFQERQMLHNAFTLPSLISRRLGGGLSLWNRAQMVSCSFSPKPDVPGTAWPVEAVL